MIGNDNIKPRSAYTDADYADLAYLEKEVDKMGAKIARKVTAASMMDEAIVDRLNDEIHSVIDPLIDIMAEHPQAQAHDLEVFRQMLFRSVVRHGGQIARLQTFEGGRA